MPRYELTFKNEIIIIFKEQAGVISEDPIWVAVSRPYIYTADTLEELFEVFVNEWHQDKHLGE